MGLGQTLANFGEGLFKEPILILILVLLLAKAYGVW